MAGRIDFSIRGAREIEAVMRELGPIAAAKVGDQALRAAARVWVKEARRQVRVDTGELRDSITVVAPRGRNRQRASSSIAANQREILIGFETPTSRRAHIEEFGTSKMPAHPFIRPSGDSSAPEMLNTMAKTLDRGVTREAEKLAQKKLPKR